MAEEEDPKSKKVKPADEKRAEPKKTSKEWEVEEELKVKIEEEFAKLKVKDVVAQTMITLSSLGYQKLGLPEEQNKRFKDLNQAKLAIDTLHALIKVAEDSLSSDEVSAFKSTLANLQLSYVKASEG